MESSPAIIAYLKGLSPVFEKLVEKALKKDILILTFKKFFEIASKEMHLTSSDKKTILGACNFLFRPGMQRIIIVAWPEIKYNIRNGELGLIELGFAHEIGHNLTWNVRPSCGSNPSGSPPFIRCECFELLAFYLALQFIDEARRDLSCTEKTFFRGKRLTYLEILHQFDLPYCVKSRIKKCYGLKVHGLKKCPMTKQVKIFIKEIEKCKI